jgi:DNA-binding CsgD family transcriptional regulator
MAGKQGQLTKDNPAVIQRNKTIASLRMDGDTLERIGNKLGYSKGHISHLINHDESIKQLIEDASRCQAAMLPKAIEQHANTLTSKDTSTKDMLHAIKMVYQNTGIAPSHAQPTVINNIMYQNNQLFSPQVLEGFKQWFFGNRDAIDVSSGNE